MSSHVPSKQPSNSFTYRPANSTQDSHPLAHRHSKFPMSSHVPFPIEPSTSFMSRPANSTLQQSKLPLSSHFPSLGEPSTSFTSRPANSIYNSHPLRHRHSTLPMSSHISSLAEPSTSFNSDPANSIYDSRPLRHQHSKFPMSIHVPPETSSKSLTSRPANSTQDTQEQDEIWKLYSLEIMPQAIHPIPRGLAGQHIKPVLGPLAWEAYRARRKAFGRRSNRSSYFEQPVNIARNLDEEILSDEKALKLFLQGVLLFQKFPLEIFKRIWRFINNPAHSVCLGLTCKRLYRLHTNKFGNKVSLLTSAAADCEMVRGGFGGPYLYELLIPFMGGNKELRYNCSKSKFLLQEKRDDALDILPANALDSV